MTKRDLMAYVKALCEAEEGLYACDEVNRELEKKLKQFDPEESHRLNLPGRADEPARPKLSGGDDIMLVLKPIGCAILGAGGVFLLIVAYIFGVMLLDGLPFWNLEDKLIPESDWVYYILMIIGGVLGAGGGWGDAASTKESNQTAIAQYDQEYADYLKRQACIAEEKKNRTAIQKEIREAIQENQRTRSRLQQTLAKLYAKGIIYQDFRHMVAVHQIYSYLAMGVCDTLEGPQGAYSQYLTDMRVNRICGSIDDLKRSMVSAMGAIAANQRTLLTEMRSVNQNITAIGAKIDSGYEGMSEVIRNMQTQSVGTDRKTQEILTQIRNDVRLSAHNQYIALRESNVNRYLLNNPYLQ